MTVTVFGMPGCNPCAATKKWLNAKGVDFIYRDITVDPAANNYITSQGFSSVPVVETDTGTWTGFVPAKMKELVA